MANKTRISLLVLTVALLQGCSHMALSEDFGKSIERNKLHQTVNLSAPQESHPEVMMDGQKAAKVIDNYRQEGPEVEAEVLMK